MLRRTFHLAALVALASIAAPAEALTQKAVGKAGLTLSSVADSAALTVALAALPGRPASGGSRYSVHFGGNGAPDEVATLFAPPTPFDSAVIGLLREKITPRRSSAGEFLYLVGAWGENPVLATYRSAENHGPELTNRRVIERGLEAIITHFAAQVPGGRVQVVARMRVDVGGVPNAVELDRSTGVPAMDRAIEGLMARSRYRAARLAGRPVMVWITFPVNFVVPAGTLVPPP